MSFKVEPCTGYELSFVFYIGSSDNTATEIHGRFLESDPSLDEIMSMSEGHSFDDEENLIWNFDSIKEKYNFCLEEFRTILTKTERGVSEEIGSFKKYLCECSCRVEMNVSFKTKLNPWTSFQAFEETIIRPQSINSLDANDLKSVSVRLDPCVDKRNVWLQVVEVGGERKGRSHSATDDQSNVVLTRSLDLVNNISSIDLLDTDFTSCLTYRVELVDSSDNQTATGRIVNTQPIKNPNWNAWKPPVVDILKEEESVTTISIRDVETDGTCEIG